MSLESSRDMRLIFLAAASLLLAACATQPRPGSTKPVRPGTPKPLPAPVTVPNAEWQIIGVSPNGNILHEVDVLSIRREGALTVFRDRKTIFNPRKENFLNTPQHKYSLNQWEVNCTAKTFRLRSMALLDDGGRQLLSRSFSEAEIKPMPVVKQSAAFQQVEFVCQRSR